MRAVRAIFAPLFAAAFVSACAGLSSLTTLAPDAQAPTIETVPNRADLVSGGDALVRVTLPAGADAGKAALTLNGQPVADALRPAPDGRGWLVRVAGLVNGTNTFAVTSGTRTARLDITNHPNGGPLFSAPLSKY
jgi:hypothetical protein